MFRLVRPSCNLKQCVVEHLEVVSKGIARCLASAWHSTVSQRHETKFYTAGTFGMLIMFMTGLKKFSIFEPRSWCDSVEVLLFSQDHAATALSRTISKMRQTVWRIVNGFGNAMGPVP